MRQTRGARLSAAEKFIGIAREGGGDFRKGMKGEAQGTEVAGNRCGPRGLGKQALEIPDSRQGIPQISTHAIACGEPFNRLLAQNNGFRGLEGVGKPAGQAPGAQGCPGPVESLDQRAPAPAVLTIPKEF